jgi:hypothetical protein
VNAVPRAGEDERYFFVDERGSVRGDGDSVFKIGYMPVVALGDRGGCESGNQCEKQDWNNLSAIRIGSACDA